MSASSTLNHDTVNANLVCKYCGQTFSTSQSRRGHERNKHEEVKQYLCIKCGESKSSQANLVRHMKLDNCTSNIIIKTKSVQ